MPPHSQIQRLQERAGEILRADTLRTHRRTDRLFAGLLLAEWVMAIGIAVALSPLTWEGASSSVHPHVWLAVGLGGAICTLPSLLAWKLPGATLTRHAVAVAQVAFSALLIHLTGGRIETHFHVFCSLAILATYRDPKVLVTATVVALADHLIRGIFIPQSVYGVLAASPWRTVEHATWVLFEDAFLILAIRQSLADMAANSLQTAELEDSHSELTKYSVQLAGTFQKERDIIEGALDGVVQIDCNGRIVSWNTQAEQIFGWSAAEAIARPVSELVIPEHLRAAHETGLRIYRETGEGKVLNQRLEVEGLRRDGRIFPMEIAITPVRCDGEPLFCAFIRDITARKQYEEELRMAKEQAVAANRTKSEFLANMSHEIRTPLNGILGFTELLIRDESGDEAERRDYIRTIRNSGKHLLELINDILDLSKIEAGQMQVEQAACSPHHLIAEVVSVLRARAQEKALSLDYRWDSEIPESIESDPYRVRQLLMNLVGNAVKFTETGRVDIIARLHREGAQPQLLVEVRDTGIGISPEHLEAIFKPFVQADNSMTRKFGGTGLGLTISKNICESLGGRLCVESTLGEGSKFTVALPVGDLAGVRLVERPPTAGNGDLADSRQGSANLEGIRVLLVDDGETNRKLIQLFLSRQGADVVVAENGELAVAAAQAREFDVILMDMQMPVMDGYAATRKLRESRFERPIIALTAHAMIGDRAKCEEAGCSGYVTKPVNVDELVRVVQAAARGERRRSGDDAHSACASPVREFGRGAIRSTLPDDDQEIREVVAEFAATIPERIDSIEQALANLDYDAIASLAHALKGAGGTAGFGCLIDLSERLEESARQQSPESIPDMIDQLRLLHERIVV